jgi:hypothetical protein
MKVNIGPYKGWTGPYQIADKIFFWLDQHGIYDDDDPRLKRWDYKAHDKLGNWLASTWVSDFCNWFDNKKKRKVKFIHYLFNSKKRITVIFLLTKKIHLLKLV